MSGAPNVEVCELWPCHDPKFIDRQYTAWYEECAECSTGTKVIVTNRTHTLLKEKPDTVRIVCIQYDDRAIVSK
jgi:hypothetical protein